MSTSHSQPAENIDQVVEQLREIIDRSKRDDSRIGYFAALYARVTVTVRDRIRAGGYFDDDPRMERLDVVFANRYLAALHRFRTGQPATRSWDYAFHAAGQRWPIVLQHLLLAINAHINLDLGVASARTVGSAAELADLRGDFDRINGLLASLVADVQRRLEKVWPPLRLFDWFLGDAEEVVINFSMQKARDYAWSLAERLVVLDADGQAAEIDRVDQAIIELARAIRHPGLLLGSVTKAVRLCERGHVGQIVELLDS